MKTSSFRYTGPGKHYAYIEGEHRLLEVGNIVELTEEVYISNRDRFERVGPPPETKPEPKPEPAPLDVSVAEEIVAATVPNAVATIANIDRVDLLEAIEEIEARKDRPRKGVMNAVEQRLVELTG